MSDVSTPEEGTEGENQEQEQYPDLTENNDEPQDAEHTGEEGEQPA